ncbi:hypothetical protein ACRAWD_27745 [Caulobacter segnis]
MLLERAKLRKGQKVLIHAGSGGVGTFAIQLAKRLDASVAHDDQHNQHRHGQTLGRRCRRRLQARDDFEEDPVWL